MNVFKRSINGELVEYTIDGVSQSLIRPLVKIRNNPVWPVWARVLRQFSKPEDKGIGDVVLRIIGNENSESFKAWHMNIFGKPCNCNGRLNRWNVLYPLP